jgi:hypothetical protein
MMRTPESNSAANSDELSISLIDVAQYIKRYYKFILSIGLACLVCAIVSIFVLGNYTATVSLQNLSGIDIPSLKYLQSALPKLEQENQEKQKDKSTAYLGSDQFWVQSIKPIILVGKADGKDLLDPSSLKSAGSNIASLQFTAKGTSEAVAESRIDEMTKIFINGAAYIGLRDLLRGYELKVIAADSNLNKKIGSAEVELVFVERRIQNLMILKNQYPSVATAPLQVVDAKDSGAKYLPISTQIVATTTDANSLRESLARYRDEEKQLLIYTQFIEKAKPLIDNGRKDANLVDSLLEVANQIEKNTQGTVEKLAIEDIRVALTSIKTNKDFGLRQAGTIAITPPPYLKNTAIGLVAGLFLGFLLALGLTLVNQYKSTLSTASKLSPVSS